VVSVSWKVPTAPWVKVNTDGFVIGNHGAGGGLFMDNLGTFHCAFTCNLGSCSVFTAEVHGFILALEYVAQRGWSNIWLESDYTSDLLVFKNLSLVPVLLRNRWHNACSLRIQVISSHFFHEANCCADRLASMGHSVDGAVWLSFLPTVL
jgi:ribonuclease HI